MNAMIRIAVIPGLAALAFIPLTKAREVSDDFKLLAKYSAGFSTWKQWETTITADGKAIQRISPGRKGGDAPQKTSTVSPEVLKSSADTIEDAESSVLKNPYRSKATDQPNLILVNTRGKKTHKVVAYGPSLLKRGEDRDNVQRFLRVYSEVLRRIPSPNPEQTPELYSSEK